MLALAEASHKMKGAAALLGLQDLENPLAKLERDARAGQVSDLAHRVEALEATAVTARKAFADL